MRYRFRGNNPVGTSQEIHPSGGEDVQQLYGGRPALSGIEGTDGREDEKDNNSNGDR